jgi:hypothetical protein
MKQAKAPEISSLIDRCSRSLEALRRQLSTERDVTKLVRIREDITVKQHRLDHLRAEEQSR